jgi:tetratricopeptide (TPR) repeat protein
MRSKITYLLYSLVACAILGGVAWMVLVSPENPLVTPFRAHIENSGSRVISGPFPLRTDFPVLKGLGVKTVVSLLDPRLPYEAKLLEQEREMAREYDMRLLNFPLTSIMGRKMRADYEQTARAAADAVTKAEGRVYLHCYLGLHRVRSVRDLLEAQGTAAGRYAARRLVRPTVEVEEAEADFRSGKYQQALGRLKGTQKMSPSARMIAAWSSYRLQQYDRAAQTFEELTRENPESAEARGGLGYCDLQRGLLDQAAEHFTRVLAREPKDASALVGLGLVRQRQGNTKEAAALLKAGVKEEPGNEEASAILRSLTSPARAR